MRKQASRKREAPSQQETAKYDRITKMEAQILDRIQKLKTNTKSCVCEHFSMTSSQAEPYQQEVNYYDRFWKRFLMNEIGKQNITQFKTQLDNFARKLQKIQSLFEEWTLQVEPLSKMKKRSSRMEEGRSEVCPYCQKTYRDEETLVIHIKIKHNPEDGADSNREEARREESIFESENYD